MSSFNVLVAGDGTFLLHATNLVINPLQGGAVQENKHTNKLLPAAPNRVLGTGMVMVRF